MVVLQDLGIPMVLVEMGYEVLRARPHEDVVRGVAEMVCETATKVAGPEDEHLGFLAIVLVREHSGAGGRGKTCPEAYVDSEWLCGRGSMCCVLEGGRESKGEKHTAATRSPLGYLTSEEMMMHVPGAALAGRAEIHEVHSRREVRAIKRKEQRCICRDASERTTARQNPSRVRLRVATVEPSVAAGGTRGSGSCAPTDANCTGRSRGAQLCPLKRPSGVVHPSPRYPLVPVAPYSRLSCSRLSLFHHITMPVQDRTTEFRACVDSIRNRSSFPARGAEQRQRLLQAQAKGGSSKTEFTRMASSIGKDISSTTVKLGKLAQRESFCSMPRPALCSFGFSREAENSVR